MVYAHCILGTEGYKYTLRICNIYCFSIATMVVPKRVIVAPYVPCLSCLLRVQFRPLTFLCNGVYVMYLQVLLGFI
jgi:hypothetical protein